eukprot:scaffold6638_cov127-Cylindrotheca_fusiformis.AAC.17
MRLISLISWSFLATSASSLIIKKTTSTITITITTTTTMSGCYRVSPFQLFMENSAADDPEVEPRSPKQENNDTESNDDEVGQANTRFSKFAPDPSLSEDDFRATLKENMKADLERRRREDPNRGNQPAKTYLDSL